MFKGYKYRIYPTKEQKILLAKHFGCVRFVYNQALDLKNKYYQETTKSLSRKKIQDQLPVWKKEEETQWLSQVSSQSLQQALLNLDIAFTNFFKKRAKYPKFKSKTNRQSCSFPQNCSINFNSCKFFCPKFKEGIKTVFSRKFNGKIKTCTISQSASEKYFVSILVEYNTPGIGKLPIQGNKCLGIDMGIKDFATFSNKTKIENPKFLNKQIKKLKRLNRQHSHKKKGSKNRNKSRIKLAIQHEKVANSRMDFQHKLSHKIAENQGYTSVAMETLNIEEMLKNKKLARYIKDVGWGQFKAFLKYKLEVMGKTLIEINQFSPSSKMCSCGHINQNLKLKDREWTCQSCNTTHDRDILAANNIKRFAFIEKFVGKDIPEFTPLETRVSESEKEECLN